MFALRCVLLALVAFVTLSAAGDVRRRAVRNPAPLEIYPLAGYSPTLASTTDLAPFGALVGDASVVGLGESWHKSGGFYLMKHRLFRYLVQEKGFRAFAMESNWEAVERTNAYVQTCAGTAESAIAEEIAVWHSTEYADLIRWMCEWNSTHSNPADRLTAFGFDIQQPERDGPALDAFLSQFGVPQNDPRRTGLRSCDKAFGRTHPFGEIPPAVHATCIESLAGIESFLQTNRTTIVEQTSQETFEIAMLRVIGLRANQEEVFEIRDHFAKGFNYRDVGMAYAFHVRRAMKAPGAKTALWAADVHVAQNMLPNGEQPLGSHLEAALGDDYVSFAITAYESETPRASGVCGLAARMPGSAEEQLATYGLQTMLARPGGGKRQHQVLPMGFFTFRPFADFDGIFFLQRSPAMHTLNWQYCQ
ncbi:MAG TPA: erythromycin esterase family protein [Thermoanaerobaculia bacterium]|jgi:erythromycin esterase-like protein|nr:erythromycin esterase family protein [Thermoanaerobaculia bacterium]